MASAGGSAVLAGVLPTPAVALLRLDLGVVISASHNPPEYNGVKFFDRMGGKLSDAAEEEIEQLLDEPARGGGEIDRVGVASDSYLEHVLERFGTDLSGLRIAVDCANGAYAGLAPQAFEQLGAEVTAIGNAPDGTNINVGCGATDLARSPRPSATAGSTSASRSTATATGCSPSTRRARPSTATRSSRSSRSRSASRRSRSRR